MANPINPPGIVRQDTAEVDQLAFEVNSAIEQGDMHTKKGIERYIEAGEGLLRMQAKIPFGQWLATLKQRVKCSQANVYRYMRAAREKAKLIGPINLEQFLRLLAEKAPEPESIETGSVSTPFVDQAYDVQNPQPSGLILPRMPASSGPPIAPVNAPPVAQTSQSPQAEQQEIMCVGCQRKRRVGQPMPKNCPECKRAREEEPPWDQPGGSGGTAHDGAAAAPASAGTAPAGNGAGSGTPAGPSTPPASALSPVVAGTPTVGGGGSSGGSHEQHMVKCPVCRGKGEVNDKKAAALRFVPPTLEEVTAYCKERKNLVDPEQFMAHYESNGWKVGKVPMRNWKGCVVTWEKNQGEFGPTKKIGEAPKSAKTQSDRERIVREAREKSAREATHAARVPLGGLAGKIGSMPKE